MSVQVSKHLLNKITEEKENVDNFFWGSKYLVSIIFVRFLNLKTKIYKFQR